MDEVHEPITDYFQLDLNKTYTYADYMLFHFKERVELIKGKIFKMSPAPNTNHQRLVTNISGKFYNFFDKHACQLFIAPFDVRLPIASALKDTTVVQPDLGVICDLSKLDEQGCNGAPDLVVEILSPGNTRHEMRVKFDLYEESGVKEYWIVEPANKTVLIYVLQNEKFIGLRPFTSEDTIESILFPEMKIDARDLFYNLK